MSIKIPFWGDIGHIFLVEYCLVIDCLAGGIRWWSEFFI
ncbi:hypothetical protein VAE151_630237 [Vibrio aestuarianus]|nr:hypothetical protein VAE130_600240 [Vibrio aestuarianus]CAH8233868.1 hypothetical protein VAE151_630237 [Vibrio aestuarianus]